MKHPGYRSQDGGFCSEEARAAVKRALGAASAEDGMRILAEAFPAEAAEVAKAEEEED